MIKAFSTCALAATLCSSLALPAGAAPQDRSKIALPSAISVDLAANTVTLPLFRGTSRKGTVWYIKTDVSDAALAQKEGLLFSPALSGIGDGAAIVEGDSSAFTYEGSVDFTPDRELKAGPDGSPSVAKPGSVGDANYSPFVHVRDSKVIYNAPIVAAGDHPSDVRTHRDTLDRVVAIDTKDAKHATVSLVLARGFTAGKPISYISTDASDAGAATLERCTFAPRLAKAAQEARVPIFVFFNGRSDDQAQGIGNALAHGHLGDNATPANASSLGSPLNIQSTFPGPGTQDTGYTPLWDVQAAIWTTEALSSGKATQLRTPEAVTRAVADKTVTGPGGKPFGAVGIAVDCPVISFVGERPR